MCRIFYIKTVIKRIDGKTVVETQSYVVDEALKDNSQESPNYLQNCLREGKYLLEKGAKNTETDSFEWHNISLDKTTNIIDSYYTADDEAAIKKLDVEMSAINDQKKYYTMLQNASSNEEVSAIKDYFEAITNRQMKIQTYYTGTVFVGDANISQTQNLTYENLKNNEVEFPENMESTYEKYLQGGNNENNLSSNKLKNKTINSENKNYLKKINLDLRTSSYERKYKRLVNKLDDWTQQIQDANVFMDAFDENGFDDELRGICSELELGKNQLDDTIDSGKLKDEKLMQISLNVQKDIENTLRRWNDVKNGRKPESFQSSFFSGQNSGSNYNNNFSENNNSNQNKEGFDLLGFDDFGGNNINNNNQSNNLGNDLLDVFSGNNNNNNFNSNNNPGNDFFNNMGSNNNLQNNNQNFLGNNNGQNNQNNFNNNFFDNNMNQNNQNQNNINNQGNDFFNNIGNNINSQNNNQNFFGDNNNMNQNQNSGNNDLFSQIFNNNPNNANINNLQNNLNSVYNETNQFGINFNNMNNNIESNQNNNNFNNIMSFNGSNSNSNFNFNDNNSQNNKNAANKDFVFNF